MTTPPLIESVVIEPDAPQATSPLSSAEVRVFALDLDAAPVAENERLLSSNERAEADRFKTERLRDRYVARRGLLRQILGSLTETSPDEVEWVRGEYGKPQFRKSGADVVEFNLSHSGPIAVVATALGRPVGVDIERIRPFPDLMAIVDRFFTPEERAGFAALPETERMPAFFGVWTRKEAYAKATGLGIAATLSEVSVSTGPVSDPRILSIGNVGLPDSALANVDPSATLAIAAERVRLDPSAWRLCDVPTQEELAVALVGAGNDWHHSTVRWP